MDIEDAVKSLISLGLAESEAKIYSDLQFHGESKTGGICERTKVKSSHVYSILNGLLDKGLVSYKVINKVKFFSASGPDSLVNLLEKKEKKLQEEKENVLNVITKLKVVSKKDRLTDFQYFQGISGIKSMFTEIMNLWKEGDNYYVVATTIKSFEKLEPFFLEFHKKRIKDKVSIKLILDKNAKNYGNTREKMPRTEVKYIDQPNSAEYGILNDYLFLASYGTEPYGLLIKDKNFAESHKALFDVLWKIAKK